MVNFVEKTDFDYWLTILIKKKVTANKKRYLEVNKN